MTWLSRRDPSGPVVVITGASSGIGRATAHAFACRGAGVVLAARSAEGLAAAERECVARGGRALVVPTDVSDPRQVEALLAAARQQFGRVDVVVHAAAVLAYGRFEDIPAEVFDRVLAVNVTGTANVGRAALRCFREQGGGRLVVVGSLLGNMATPLLSPYVTSKWAIHGLIRVLRLEARETPGVRVGLVWPGAVNTPAYSQAGNYTGRAGRPPPPVVSPEKVARRIVRAAERPGRSMSVGPANQVMVFGFRRLPALFEALVVPCMRGGGLSRQPIGAGPGNVFEPRPEGEAVHGRWGRHWLRPVVLASTAGAATAIRLALRRRQR
jgi:NAD(P)-dependent dehydrogenase (short-subunit alcohol dehydrogenase family)